MYTNPQKTIKEEVNEKQQRMQTCSGNLMNIKSIKYINSIKSINHSLPTIKTIVGNYGKSLGVVTLLFKGVGECGKPVIYLIFKYGI